MAKRKLRRWAAGDRVNSAGRLNQIIDEVQELRDVVSARQVGQVRGGIFRNIYIQTVEPALGNGIVHGEWVAAAADAVPVYLWPTLYPSSGYTYTNNNNRTHTASATAEALVPQLAAGELLRVELMYLPGPDAVVWVDCNRVGRMWGEVV